MMHLCGSGIADFYCIIFTHAILFVARLIPVNRTIFISLSIFCKLSTIRCCDRNFFLDLMQVIHSFDINLQLKDVLTIFGYTLNYFV